MSDRAIYYIAHEPLRWEPIRDKAGEIRRFTREGARSFTRRWLGHRFTSLQSVAYGAPPMALRLAYVGDGMISIGHGDSNLGGRYALHGRGGSADWSAIPPQVPTMWTKVDIPPDHK